MWRELYDNQVRDSSFFPRRKEMNLKLNCDEIKLWTQNITLRINNMKKKNGLEIRCQ